MKEKNIKIIIATVSVAVTVLIAIQIYWILNVIKLENERFDASAANALEWVVSNLEKNKTASVVFDKLLPNTENDISFLTKTITGDSIHFITQDSNNTNVITHYNSENGGLDMHIEVIDTSVTGTATATFNFKGYSNNSTYIFSTKQTPAIRKKLIREKSKIVKEVVDELITLDNPQVARKNIKLLPIDSLLGEGLNKYGITTSYEYSIIDDSNNSVVFSANGKSLSDEQEKIFKTILFPDELFGTTNYLQVSFPEKTFYIAKSVSLLLVISILLILFISTMFYRTVKMLLRQKKISEVKNDLINNITHEFKTPISTIALACEALNEPALNKDVNTTKRYGEIIKEENVRLKNMVEQILTTAALEKGINNFAVEPVNINDIINDVAGKFYPVVIEKSGILDVQTNSENFITGNDIHLYNVLHNLVDNAVKYSGDNPHIKVASKDYKGGIKLTVQDDGPGIPKNEVNKIFESFYRISTGNVHDVKGHGLGLNYVKKMVEAHNGKIDLDTASGKGSKFSIIFPGIK